VEWVPAMHEALVPTPALKKKVLYILNQSTLALLDFLIAVTKYTRETTKRGKVYFGSHFSPWSLVPVILDLWQAEQHGGRCAGRGCSSHGGQEAEREGEEDKIWPLRTRPCDVLPLVRLHLLVFPEPPQMATSWGPSPQQ
jgi:hypothetical protein